MGILADVFVAERDAALKYEQAVLSGSSEALARFSRAQYRGLTGLEFGTLWAIIEDAEWAVDRHMLNNIAQGDGGETWLDEFPPELVQVFASLDAQAIPRLCVTWGATEELNCSGSELQPVVADLIRLAREAVAKNRPMFLWGSL